MLSQKPAAGIGLFDMDGTLLAWDCQLLFRHHVLRAERWRYYSVPLFLMFLPFAGLLGTENMKRVFLCFLWRMSAERQRELSREFAERLLPSIYPEMVEAIRRHKAEGDLVILSSASPECYVVEIGKLLEFDLSLGTALKDNALFPDLLNHKGENKVTRLRNILPESYFRGGKLVRSHGYTDSTADLPMLAICEKATVVNPKDGLQLLAETRGWEVVRITRPWSSRLKKFWCVLILLFALGENPAKL